MSYPRWARLGVLFLGMAGGFAVPLNAQADLPEKTRLQIAELLADKQARTPAQRKLGSHLIYASRMLRGQRLTRSVARLPLSLASINIRRQTVEVDVNGNITDSLIQAVKAAGGQVVAAVPEYHTMRAWIPLQACERLAERDDVGNIVPAAMARSASPRPILRTGKRKSVAKLRARKNPLALFSPFDQLPPTDVGGIIAHGADLVHALGYDGTGVKVAAISDGVDSLSILTASGYLPVVTVLPGQAGSGDEGTALLNVIHDMAPGAQLFYATGWTSSAKMAQSIRQLVDVYGVNILVDDVQYSDDGFFQDTTIAQAITYAASKGAMYFSAAANDGNLDSATSGTWVGDFLDGGGITLDGTAYRVHNFGADAAHPVLGNMLGFQPRSHDVGNWIVLEWADPWDNSTNDYDLFVVNTSDMSVAAASTDPQYGSSWWPPKEFIQGGAAGYKVYVVKHPSADSVALQVNTGRATLARGTNGAVYGHPASKDAVTVAATNVYYTNHEIGGGTIFTGGTANPVDIISSDGPRPMFLDPNGHPLNPTAANPYTFAGGGATFLDKVDFTAADAIHTAVPNFDPFGGTSAAAPHAAAIGALVKSADPYITGPHTLAVIKSTALKITGPNVEQDVVTTASQGAGIAMANRAVAALKPSVTIASDPPGLGFSISGTDCSPGSFTTPKTLSLWIDAPCTISLDNTTLTTPTTRSAFTAWSDGETANPRSFTGPVSATTITATYQQQYQLTLTSSPAEGGSITADPAPSDGYYNSNSMVQLTAKPADGYTFVSWGGSASGSTNPMSILMTAGKTVTANFVNPALSPVNLTMVSESETAGNPVEIPIQLSASGPLYPASFQFDLSFDQTKLAYTSARVGSALTSSGKGLSAQPLPNGDIHFQTTGSSQATIPNGVVAYAKLTLSPQFKTGSTILNLKSCQSTDAQGTNLATPCVPVEIESGWCDPTGDQTVNAADVMVLVKEILKILLTAHDINRDLVVNIVDVQRIVNAATGGGCPY